MRCKVNNNMKKIKFKYEKNRKPKRKRPPIMRYRVRETGQPTNGDRLSSAVRA